MLLVPARDDRGSFEEFRAHPPVGDPPFSLGRGLVITDLDPDLLELIYNACEARGHFFFPAVNFGFRYAFVLDHPPAEERQERWDPDDVIYQAVALSRLVRDNAYSTEHAARVVEYEGGEVQIRPYDGDLSRYAYSSGAGRDWLDAQDAARLASLLKVFWADENALPARVTGALWRIEHLAHEHYLDVVLPGYAAGLEGLLSTSTAQARRQFEARVPALAAELGVPGVSRRMAGQMYTARSQAVHGADIDLFTAPRTDANVQKVVKMQTVLRAAVRRAVEDPAFRAVFADDEAVRARWPVRVPGRWLRRRRRAL